MKILVLTNLFPPHHAGTFDFRCQSVTETLVKRGHRVKVLTSNYGLQREQRDPEIERRLWINGAFGLPLKAGLSDLKTIEAHNHQVLRETLTEFAPDLVYVWSLHGLSKSLIFTIRNSRLPTVYDVADSWIADGLREDPWLRWWNGTSRPIGSTLWRTMLEIGGRRNSLDKIAPTRLAKGYDRVAEIYGKPQDTAAVEANTIGAFRFDRLYFCSHFLRQRTEQAGFRVSHGDVIYPGTNTELYIGEVKPQSAPIRKFLIVAELTEKSGVMTALEALKIAREYNVKTSLSIHGRGSSDYVASLRSFIIQHQLPVEFLTLTGQPKDMAALYRQHDAFLHTAETEESYATTPFEAMASGLPVISTKLGGIGELLLHGENAFTYNPKEALDLASRMQEIQIQPALRCQVAERGQAEVLGRFNDATVADQIENYLNTTLEVWQHT